MIVSVLSVWLSCGVIAAFIMSRILSHGRAPSRAQRSMNH